MTYILEWIPVAERLPENDDSVLITYSYNGGQRYVEEASYHDHEDGTGEWYSVYDEYLIGRRDRKQIHAWMPIPKPYKGD